MTNGSYKARIATATTGTGVTSGTGDLITGAAWDRTKVLYVAIDNENGDDSRAGGVVAAAGTTFTTELTSVAWKTLEKFRAAIPRFGNGCALVCLMKARSDAGNFKKQDGTTSDWLDIGYDGYSYIAFRASDLTNGTNDRLDLQGVIESGDEGPAAGNKWTVSSQSSFAITNTTGTLPSATTIAGKKLRFDGNITSALRTTSREISDRTGATVLDMVQAATAANGDLYQINTPGVKVTTIVGTPGLSTVPAAGVNYVQGMQVVGIRFSAATTAELAAPVQMQFVRFDAATTILASQPLIVTTSYQDETGTLIAVGVGIDAKGSFVARGQIATMAASAFHSTSQFFGLGQQGGSLDLLRSAYCVGLVTVTGLRGAPTLAATASVIIGGSNAGFHVAKFLAGATITDSECGLSRISLDGSTAPITFVGYGRYNIDTVTGALASAVNAFSFAGAFDTRATFGTGVATTESGGGVDILMAGSVTATFASLTTSPQIDAAGNIASGSAGLPVKKTVALFSGVFVGAAGAATCYLADNGGTAADVLAAAVNYPMPACRVRNLRVQASVNPLAANLVVRVLKNGAATGITATITTGSTALFSDTTNEGQFAAGDKLDIDMTETGVGTASVAASVEIY